MLQATSPPTTESGIVPENAPRESVNRALGIVRRQFAVIALIAVVVTSLGAFYAFMAPPTYTAGSTVAIDPRRVQLSPKATFSEGQIDLPALESEIELVKSEPVALSVIKDLGLAKDPEFLGPQGVFGAVLGFASHFFSASKPNKPLSESEATRAALEVFSKNLAVKRVGLSYHLSIQYRSGNPNRAAQIANAIAEAYIAEQLEGKYDSTRRATEWLKGRLEELNQKQARAERAVVDFKKQNNVVTADGKLVNEQQIAELNSQLVVAHKQTSEAKARLERIDAVIRDDSFDTTGPTVADTLNNALITQLRTKYLDFVNREAEFARKYGANHLATVNLRDQIRGLRGSILEELKRLRESYLSNYTIAKQEEQELEKRLAEAVSRSQPINQAQIPLRELESSAQNYRTTYDNLHQRYTESLQQQSFPISDARILTSASPPSGKSSPKTALVLVLAAAGGLVFGVAVGALRDLMNGSFCTKAQVENALQTACISVVPIVVDAGKRQTLTNAPLAAPDQVLEDSSSSRTIVRDQDLIWTALNSPFSRFAEALRSIKVAIDGAAGSGRAVVSKDGKPLYGAAKASSRAKREREGCAIIGFTSSLPHEGKSTIAASLALLMAQAGA